MPEFNETALPRYQLWYTDDRGERLAVINKFAFLNFTRVVNGVGTLTLGLPFSEYGDIFRRDYHIEVWRAPLGRTRRRLEDVYFMERRRIYTRVDNVTILEIGGANAMAMLERRIVKYKASTSQSAKTGSIDDMMKDIVDENFGAQAYADDPDRAIPYNLGHFSVQANSSGGASITKSFPFRNVRDILRELAEQSKINTPEVYFDVVPITPSTFQFQTFLNQRGADRRFSAGKSAFLFSTKRGSLESPSMESSYFDHANVVYAGGQGEGTSRTVEEREDTGESLASIWARTERFRDARQEATVAGVRAAGDAELGERRPRTTFNTNFLDTLRSVYGLDWGFGDRVTVDYADQLIDAMIRVVYFSVDENGAEKVYARAEFGEFEA